MTMTTTSSFTSEETTSKGDTKVRVSILFFWAVSIVLALLLMFANFTPVLSGILVIALTVSLLTVGIPVAFSMLIAGFIGLWSIGSASVAESIVSEAIFSTAASWSLSVIPGFIMMGSILGKSGLVSKLFESARVFIGRLPGGLAVGTTFAGAGFASISGSSIGVAYALGRVALPSMLRAGYNKRLATGTVAIVGTLGQLIPPSILLVVYAGVAQTPIGAQLVSAIIPAALLALSYVVLILVRSSIDKTLAPPSERVPWTGRFVAKSLFDVVPVLTVFLGVVGGIFFGIFTATEAAIFGVLASLVVSWVFNRDFRSSPLRFLRSLRDAAAETIAATAMIFLLLTGVSVLTTVLSLSRVTNEITNSVVELGLGRIQFLLLLVVIFLLLGLFLDPMAMILLTVPILMEPLAFYGIDLIWFGIFVLVMAEVAQVTPPVGMMTFIIHNISKDPAVNLGNDISLSDVFRGVIPFVLVTLAVLVGFIYFPEVTEILQPSGTGV